MKKITTFLVLFSMLISASFTIRAEDKTALNGKYNSPGYAGAVFADSIELMNEYNATKLFSDNETPVCDYIYDKLWDLEYSSNNTENMYYCIKDENGVVITEGSDDFVHISLSGYSVTKAEFVDIVNYLVNEKGELLLGQIVRTETGGNYVRGFYVPYAYDISEIASKRNEIKRKADDFIQSLGNYELLSQRERVLLTHDFIANNALYAPSDIENIKYHTLYSALVEGVTVCQGYTQAMCYILNQIGVECVSCLNDYGNHVWNCVNVDGQWSHIDLTWDDARFYTDGENEALDFIGYKNFMTNAETMIENKMAGYSQYSGSYAKNEFAFPSGKLEYDDTEFESDQDEYAYNYLTYSILNNTIHFLPSGFEYENNALVHTLNVHNGGNYFAGEYKFVYDNLLASNSAASIPLRIDGGYAFMILPLKGTVDLNNIRIFMADSEDNMSNINELEINGGLGTSDGMYLLKFFTSEDLITNSNRAKFFFWDNNMQPYTQPTYKTVQ